MRESLGQPFAVFGHDLGALIAFELARALRRMSLPQPARLFLSGHRAPNLPRRFAEIHRLEESEFRKELRLREDVSVEVLEHNELMAVVSPMLRADFEIEETYRFVAEDPLDVPFTIFGGLSDDRVGSSELEAWRQQTRAEVHVEMLPGDHHLQTQHTPLLQIVNRELPRQM
jgi:medium-chain acyl-[acyl-carrier-protein] hydrolase